MADHGTNGNGARMEAEVARGVKSDGENPSEHIRSNEVRIGVRRWYPSDRRAIIADVERSGVRERQTEPVGPTLETCDNPRDELLFTEEHGAAEGTEGGASSKRPIRTAAVDGDELWKFYLRPENATEHLVMHHRRPSTRRASSSPMEG